jgi:hypothetical protein
MCLDTACLQDERKAEFLAVFDRGFIFFCFGNSGKRLGVSQCLFHACGAGGDQAVVSPCGLSS